MSILHLTDEQQALIEHEGGNAVVFAIAGSGKTTTVAARIKRLINEGATPAEILAVTFTNEAVKQFAQTLEEIECQSRTEVNVLTFHKMAGRILRKAEEYGMVPGQQNNGSKKSGRQVAEEAIRRFQRGDLSYKPNLSLYVTKFLLEKLANRISWEFLDQIVARSSALKQSLLSTRYTLNSLIAPEARHYYMEKEFSLRESHIEALIDIYEIHRRSQGFRDYQDVINDAAEILSLSPEIREIACSCYKHITVDEFQDVDPSQNLLLDLACEFAESIVVVGDDDQSIYQWRGADAEFLTEKLDMGGWSVFTLQSNFRCPAKVVSLAAQSIKINQDRFPKTLRGLKPLMGNISIDSFKNRGEQAERIASEVKDIRKTRMTQQDCSIAILVRSKASISSIEQRLLEHEIPYRVLGGGFWYERKIPRGFLNILQLRRLERRRLSGNLNDKLHKVYIDTLKHVANFPNRFLSARVISTTAPSIGDNSMHLIDLLHRHWPDSSKRREAVANLLEFFDGWMIDTLCRPRDLIQAYTEIPSLLEAISSGDPESATESALEILSFKDFADRFSSDDELINEVNRQRRVNQSGLAAKNLDPSAIDIQTIHSSKGLAWDCVYVPDLNYTVFPWRPIIWINGHPEVGGADLEAERRLFYVAMTRAKESLCLSSVVNPEGTHYSNQKSEFIEELPIDWLSERWGFFDDAIFRVKSDPGVIQKIELEQIADALGFLPAFKKLRENALEESF